MTINDIITAAWLEMPAGGPARSCLAHRAETWLDHELPSWLAGPGGFAACRISPDGPCCAQFSLRIDENGMWHFTRSNIGQEAYSRLHAAWPGLKGGEEAAPRRKRPGRVFDGAWLISEQWPTAYDSGKVYRRAQNLIHLTFLGKGGARRPAWVLEDALGMSEAWRTRRPKAFAEYEDLVLDGKPIFRAKGSQVILEATRETPSPGAMAALRDHVAKRRLAAL
jgi:hypothetical protein